MVLTAASQANREQDDREAVAEIRRPLVATLARFARKNELALAGGIFLALVILGAILAPLLTPYSPVDPTLRDRLLGPTLAHPFGTDEFGRDQLARVLFGARSILISGLASVAIGMALGVAIGTISAYRRDWVDNALMRLMDVMLSFPAILLAILIVASLGAGQVNSIIAISFSLVPVFSRLVRSVVLSLVHHDYVSAANSLGGSDWWIVRRHLMPNMLPPIIVQASAMLAVAISYASALNFIGLGVKPPTPDWGLMVSEGQRLIFDAPYVPFFPGLAITLTVLSANLIGDGLRDYLDPTLKNL
jgi:ABC-type dipeptide/oligopeptide/nickel transport system permease subunit